MYHTPYVPLPEELRQRAAEVRATWSEETIEKRRAVKDRRVPWTAPTIPIWWLLEGGVEVDWER